MADFEAIHTLKSTDPPLWLTPSPHLSQTARTASKHLFASILSFCHKSQLNTLLVEGFEAEQIWQQIDLQTEALLANLKRDVKRFEKDPGQISKFFGGEVRKKKEVMEEKESKEAVDDDDDDEEGDSEGFGDMEEDEGEEDEEEEDQSDGEFEDKFLKMKDLEEYMKKDEEREYGGLDNGRKGDEKDDEDDDDEIGEDSVEEDDKLGQAN